MKRFFFILIGVIAFLFALIFFTQKWIEANLERLINQKPDRAYKITYENLKLKAFAKGLVLENVSITPLNTDQGTLINGSVELVEVTGFSWRHLVFGREAQITELVFVQPDFELTIKPADTTRVATSKKVQQLFGDILSRGNLKRFRLVDGSFTARLGSDSLDEIGHIDRINLEANDLETDSLQWKYPIPFKLGEFRFSAEGMYLEIDPNTTLTAGSLSYRPRESKVEVRSLSLKFNKDWLEVSEEVDKQIDLIEAELKSLVIRGIGAKSKLYGDLDIRSTLIVVDSLVLKDHRDKNKERPPDREMPMFAKMVGAIPIDLRIDTIQIKNSTVSYIELPEGKSEPGAIHFTNLYGSIYNVTTLEIFQKRYKQFEADLIGKINSQGNLTARLTIPYQGKEFQLKARMDSLDMTVLNPALVPMAGVEAKSGMVLNMELDMKASKTYADNHFVLDYNNLTLTILKAKEDQRYKKRGLMSGMANSVIRSQNLPQNKNYRIADYRSDRNIYRGPFNFIWQSVKEGFMAIVPSETAQSLMGGNKEKKEKKKKKKNKEKDKQ